MRGAAARVSAGARESRIARFLRSSSQFFSSPCLGSDPRSRLSSGRRFSAPHYSLFDSSISRDFHAKSGALSGTGGGGANQSAAIFFGTQS